MVYRSEASKYRRAKASIKELKTLTEQASSNFISSDTIDLTSNLDPNKILISGTDGNIDTLNDIGIEKIEYFDGITYDIDDKLDEFNLTANSEKNLYDTFTKPYLKNEVESFLNEMKKKLNKDLEALNLNYLEVNNIENSNQLIINNIYNAPELNINGTLSASEIIFLNGESITYDVSKSTVIETESINIENNGYVVENPNREIKKYPPVPLASSTYQGISIQVNESTLDNQEYGNGTYFINWSSAADLSSYSSALFNGNKYTGDGGAWKVGSYNNDGTYNTTLVTATNIAGYSGEWVKIKFPDKILLSYIHIYTRVSQWLRAPISYTLLGTNNGQTWTPVIIDDNVTYQLNKDYESQQNVLQPNNDYFNEFAFIIHKISSGAQGKLPNFTELEFYGYIDEVRYDTVIINDNTTENHNLIELASGVENTNKFVLTKDGNIGLGVIDPQVKLDIDGNIVFSGSLNDVNKEHFENIKGITENIQQQIDNSNISILQGSNIAIELANQLFINTQQYFNSASSIAYENMLNSDIEASNYIIDTSNSLISSKMDKLKFGFGLKYNEATNNLSISEVNNLWSSNENNVLKYKNLIFHPNQIEKITTFIPENAVTNEYPSSELTSSVEISDIQNISGVEIQNHIFKWSSTRYYGNGDQYNTPTNLFNGSTDDEGYMGINYDDLGIYIETNKLLNDYYGDWVSIKFPNHILLENIILTKTNDISGAPKNFEIYGSTDGNNWERIGIVIASTSDYVTNNNIFTFSKNISTEKSYDHFAICVNEIHVSPDIQYFSLAKLQFFGKETNTYVSNAVFQEEFDTKMDVITGASSTITVNNLDANRILVSDSFGKILASSISITDLSYISDVNEPIQQKIEPILNIQDIYYNEQYSNIGNLNYNLSNYISNISIHADDLVLQKPKQTNINFGEGFQYSNGVLSFDLLSLSNLQPPSNESELDDSSSWNSNENYIYNCNIKITDNDITINEISLLKDENVILAPQFSQNDFNVDSNNIVSINNSNNTWVQKVNYLEYQNIKIYDNKILIGFDALNDFIIQPFGIYVILHSSVDASTFQNFRIYRSEWSKTDTYAPLHIFGDSVDIEESFTVNAYSGGSYIGSDYLVEDYKGEWVSLEFPEKIFVSYLHLFHKSGSYMNAPLDYKVYGVDYTGEIILLIHETSATYTDNKHISQNITSQKSFKKLVIVFNKINDIGSSQLKISNIKFYGILDKSINITELYRPDPYNIFLHYTFDSDYNDYSGNNNHAIIYNERVNTLHSLKKIGIKSLQLFGGPAPNQIYPPVHNFTSNTMTVSGQPYGNGTYIVESSSSSNEAYGAFNLTTTAGYWQSWKSSGFYSNGVYNKTLPYAAYIVDDYLGEWIKIKLPVPINLTRYGFKQQSSNFTSENYPWESPGTYKIYGSYNGSTWYELVHKTSVIEYGENNTPFPNNLTSDAGANRYFDESVTTVGVYIYFALVVNKLEGSREQLKTSQSKQLKLGEWYIYGDEANYLKIPSNDFSYSDGFSISCWVNTNNSSWLNSPIIDFADGENNNNNIILSRYSNSKKLSLTVKEGATETTALTINDVLKYNNWVHIAWVITKTPVHWYLYIDGILQPLDSNIFAYPVSTNYDNSYIGKSNNLETPFFRGNIDDFRIHKTALTSEQINEMIKDNFLYLYDTNYTFVNDTTDMTIWYKFDGINGTNDSSGNSRDATAFGTPILSETSISITKDNYLQLPNNFIDFTKDITISFWYRFDNDETNAPILNFSKITGYSTYEDVIEIYRNGVRSELYLSINGNKQYFRTNHETGKFTHFVWIITTDGWWHVYADSILVVKMQKSYPSETQYNYAYFGKNNYSGYFDTDYQVTLKDYRIYNRELLPEEVKIIYLNNNYQYIDRDFFENASDMLAWYKFDEDFTDSSGNGKDLTGGTETTFVIDRVVGTHSIYFQNTANQKLTSTVDLSGNRSFSISLWSFKYTSGGVHIMLGTGSSKATNQWLFAGYTNDKISFGFWNNTVRTDPINQDVNTWVHWTFIYDSSTPSTSVMNIYKNGVLQEITSDEQAPSSETNLPVDEFHIGSEADGGYPFIGNLDDFRIYNRVLTSEEVLKIYQTSSLYFVSIQDNNLNGSLLTDKIITTNFSSFVNNNFNITSNILVYNKNENYSMKLEKDLWMNSANIAYTSDERVKKDIKDIDDDIALEKILYIEPKTYNYIDNEKSDQKVYGFISQQIEKVFPEATSKTSRYIPNIYQDCQCISSNNFILLPDNFNIDKLNILYNNEKNTSNNYISNKLKLVRNKSLIETNFDQSNDSITNKELVVDNVDIYEEIYVNYSLTSNEYGNVLHIDNDINVPNVFVYGTEINDLTTIDKAYIYTLNACATQALSRKIDSLEDENISLQSYVETLENRIDKIKTLLNSNV